MTSEPPSSRDSEPVANWVDGGSWLRWVGWLPQLALLAMVKMYQFFGSPLMRWLGVGCRFTPTCSHYMIGALKKHGPFRGTWRGIRRVCRCHPGHPGGYDPP
ncbi:MAG: membrane protein insertion efficiency factor YidD [Planctomycetaceae bacterium]